MGFLSLCLQIPNLGSIMYYLVFLVALPAYFFTTGNANVLQYYMPFIMMLAVTLTEAGKPNNFKSLYPLPPRDLKGFMSVNIINMFALIGLLIQAVGVGIYYNRIDVGVLLGVITFAITFPMAQQVLPFFIRESHERLFNQSQLKFKMNIHKYLVGFTFIIFLMGLEYILITGLVGKMVE